MPAAFQPGGCVHTAIASGTVKSTPEKSCFCLLRPLRSRCMGANRNFISEDLHLAVARRRLRGGLLGFVRLQLVQAAAGVDDLALAHARLERALGVGTDRAIQ